VRAGALFAFALLLFLSCAGPLAAGSATSRWDLTIGGYVKFELDYRDYGRQGFEGNESLRDKYGTINFTSTASRLNFLSRGPEAYGAKTYAFVEGDFIGVYAGSGRGTFALRHAFLSLEWPDTKLIVGQTFQKWGYLPTYANAIVSAQDLNPFIKGHRQPMIRLEHKFWRQWNLSLAVMSPTNTLGSNRSTIVAGADGFSMSGMPFYEVSLGWSTERFGRIGPWMALFNLEGFYGQEKQIITLYTGPAANPLSISYADKNVDCWGIALKGFLPLIPEKKGNKAGALSLSGVLFTAQNPSWLQSRAYAVGSYSRPDGVSPAPAQPASDPLPDFVAPRMYGLWGQVSYFLTDKLFINGWYGYLRNDTGIDFDSAVSSWGRYVHANTVKNTTQYIVSLCYDANQAVRFTAEYAYYITRYANYGAITLSDGTVYPNGLSKDGTQQAFRLGVWYFF
jgi:hypothetical protein